MASEDKAVREQQFNAAKSEFETFKKTLKAKGLNDKQAAKNATFRSLRAGVKKARKRILAIDAAIAHVESVKLKETKAPKPEAPKKKSKK